MEYHRMPTKAEFMKDSNAGLFAKRSPIIQAIDKMLEQYPKLTDAKKAVVAAAISEHCDKYEKMVEAEQRCSRRSIAVINLGEIAIKEVKRLIRLLKALEARTAHQAAQQDAQRNALLNQAVASRNAHQENQRVALLNHAVASRNAHQQAQPGNGRFAQVLHSSKFKALLSTKNINNQLGVKELHHNEILEVLDDLHRAGHELDKIKTEWLGTPNAPKSFWDYLETYAGQYASKLYRVKYLNESERRAYRIRFKGNMLVQGELGKIQMFDTRNTVINPNFTGKGLGRAIFVMSVEDQIYSGGSFSNPQFRADGTIDRENSGDILHHSSFLMGSPVKCAGEWIIEKGRIIMISPQSGHYRPPADIFQAFLKMLESHGIPLNQITVSINFGGANHFYNAKAYAYASDPQTDGAPLHNGAFLPEVLNMRSPRTLKDAAPVHNARQAPPVSAPQNRLNQPQQFRPSPVPGSQQGPPLPPRRNRP